MGFHHVAVTTRDLDASHRFYTESMGFTLVKVIAAPNPEPREGYQPWSRHVFYDTGDGSMFAVWDIHDAAFDECDPAIATGLGLPVWSNHIAFGADTLDDLAAKRDRWLELGHDVVEVDHGWCTSVYTLDPNGIMVEWCTSTATFTAADTEEAHQLLAAEQPALDAGKAPIVHLAKDHARA